jgi:hypothetical protein
MKKINLLLILLSFVIYQVACSVSEEITLKADFSIVVSGQSPIAKVTFVNNSTLAISFLWQVKDLKGAIIMTSLDEIPDTLIIEKSGIYFAKLQVTDGVVVRDIEQSFVVTGSNAILDYQNVELSAANSVFSFNTGLTYSNNWKPQSDTLAKEYDMRLDASKSYPITDEFYLHSYIELDYFKIVNKDSLRNTFFSDAIQPIYSINAEDFVSMENDLFLNKITKASFPNMILKETTIVSDGVTTVVPAKTLLRTFISVPINTIPVVHLIRTKKGKLGAIYFKSFAEDGTLTVDIKLQK